MSKSILVISSSPRVNGNSDALCDSFSKGAIEAGHNVTRLNLRNFNIEFCSACYACKHTGRCVKNDQGNIVMVEMISADVIVLATPVYFYSMSGQLKTLIDRSFSIANKLSGKEFVFIATAADDKSGMMRCIDAMRGFTDCIQGAKIRNIIYGEKAWKVGEIQGTPALDEAYKAGKNI